MSVAVGPPPQQRPPIRPRSKSGFSFRSDKSGGASYKGHGRKESLVETHEEKRRTHLSVSGKANPNAAITELQPVAAALEKPTLVSLRSISYNDQFGNLITEPDRSNPTRPRWERPLDTIKSFEAAIDKEYRQQRSMMRSEVGSDAGNSGWRSRQSTYWSGGYDQARPRYAGPPHGHYGGNRDSYVESGYSPQGFPPRNRYSYHQPDQSVARYANQNDVHYASNGLHQSRDTVDTGTASGSGSEQWTNNTDPSSEDSPIDPVRAAGSKSDGYEAQYGYPEYPTGQSGNPHLGGPVVDEGSYGRSRLGVGQSGDSSYFSPNPGDPIVPAPPPKSEAPPRRIISLNSNGVGGPVQHPASGASRQSIQTKPEQKRKSWLRRTFGSRD